MKIIIGIIVIIGLGWLLLGTGVHDEDSDAYDDFVQEVQADEVETISKIKTSDKFITKFEDGNITCYKYIGNGISCVRND